jgi:hypothetical protein
MTLPVEQLVFVIIIPVYTLGFIIMAYLGYRKRKAQELLTPVMQSFDISKATYKESLRSPRSKEVTQDYDPFRQTNERDTTSLHENKIFWASQFIYDLTARRWKMFSAKNSKCGYIDLHENNIFVESFSNIKAKVDDLVKDLAASGVVDSTFPDTPHAKMLYIQGLWKEYSNMTIEQRLRYRGFFFDEKQG